jgi:G3E family GTPase
MTDAGRAGTELMSVSIIAGPASNAVLEKLGPIESKHVVVFQSTPHSRPEEIVAGLRSIATKGEVTHLIIQCEPDRPLMAYAFLFADELADVSRLTSGGFAIDAGILLDCLLDRKATSFSPSFIAEQMEFAGHLFLDGAIDNSDFALAQSIAIALNPRARISPVTEPDTAAWLSRHTTTFDFDEAINGAGWRILLDNKASTANDTVTAFGYHARRPFHPERFSSLLQKGLGGVFRAKGFFWLATRMEEVGGLNLAGSELQCMSAGHWWATRDAQTRESEMPIRTRKEWQEPFGDRRQSFAVMAMNVGRDALRRQFDSCLLSDDEMAGGEQTWSNLPDPFPSWAHVHEHHHGHECDHDHGSHDHDCCG